MMKPSPGRRKEKKQKIKWSNLYSFSCLNSGNNDDEPTTTTTTGGGSDQWLLGQPGFSRVVFCNQPLLHKIKPYKYPNNYVSTTKYNFLTFLPRALFEQFRRVANLYFLLAAGLSLTSLSPFTPASLIAPLVFVVGISMLKEALEDWRRFLQDLNVNSRKVKVHPDNGFFVEKTWKELSVGNVVRINKNEYFPGDLLLLSSSYSDGACYVETMNLDGETNLKFKRCLQATLTLDDDVEFANFQATIRCEDPNPNLYSFVGNLEFNGGTYPLSPTHILLRDSKLRNTEFAYGVMIFSGPDAKAVRNSTRSPSKRSRLERRLDYIIYALFVLLVLMSLVNAIGSSLVLKSGVLKWWYLQLKEDDDPSFNPSDAVESLFFQLVRALILYGYLIPISLYVSIEIVKVLQAMLINNDLKLYDESTGKAVVARTSNLNEELGQVEMILSDKTGTLTCNQMVFRKCSIEGTSYGGEINEVDLEASRRLNNDGGKNQFSPDGSDSSDRSIEMFEFPVANTEKKKELSFKMFDFSVADNEAKNEPSLDIFEFSVADIEAKNETSFEMFEFSVADTEAKKERSIEVFEFSVDDSEAKRAVLGYQQQAMENPDIKDKRTSVSIKESVIKGFNFSDERLMNKTWMHRSNVYDMVMFFRVMALCHTGIPVEDGNSDKLKYEAESPEEVAFLIAAQEFGFKFCQRTQSVMVVEELDPSAGMEVKREYQLLNLLEFNSSRKRMSVIVSDENGQIFLLCKGADK